MQVSAQIEAILFYKAAPVTVAELSRVIGASEEEVLAGLSALEESLSGRGIRLMRKGDEVMLGTAPEAGSRIEALIKDELAKDLGKAGLETLSIVLYRGPISRADIDYIRGVNSTFILRNLLIRGLVERIPNPNDQRSYLYQPTFELFGYLGVARVEELPEYAEVNAEINALYERRAAEGVSEMSQDQQTQQTDAS